jgi:hypothetical protein
MASINSNITIAAGTTAKAAGIDPKKPQRKEALRTPAKLGEEYQKFIQQAMAENPDQNTERVKQARELLLNGHFDTPQAAKEAAKKIVEYGI